MLRLKATITHFRGEVKMKALSAVLLVAMLGLTGYAAPAWALNFRSYVSVSGTGTACTITAPCGSMGAAVAATTNGGVISCLDSNDYSEEPPVTIAITVTIDCTGTAATAGPFTVDGAGIGVTIKNIGIFSNSGAGILFEEGAFLHVENVQIYEMNIGIQITASGPITGYPRFVIANSTLYKNGSSGEQGGILINPSAAGFVMGEISNTIVTDNLFGIIVDGNDGVTGINVSIVNSSIVNNTNDGVHNGSNSAGTFLLVDHDNVAHNGTVGINAAGTDSVIRVRASSITGNTNGVSGNVFSVEDNVLAQNGSNGTMIADPGDLQ
jgi:hypothetical protein